ncbi:MAG: S8 family serine peptidase, partial [Bacteroidota bacterium]
QWVKSGYGKVSVDLAAPGDDVYTISLVQTSPSNPYRGESGTSFAAPMIAGTITWLNSVVCKTYLQLMQQNPDSALKLMRGWILGSVEQNSSLAAKTVTGGVLQSYGAWTKMDAWCTLHEPTYSTNGAEAVSLVMYPNPTDGRSCVFLGTQPGVLSLRLLDAVGREVWRGETRLNETVRVPEGVSAGTYQWVIGSSRGTVGLTWVLR